MNVKIWDKVNMEWINIKHVHFIVQLDDDSFKLDNKEFNTNEYELNFIHTEYNANE